MSFAYVWIGVRHFTNPDLFLNIMPPYLSWHLELVYLSGAFEIVFGFGLLTKLRKYAAKGLILLLIFVFPANIYLISSQEAQIALDISRNMAIVRAPFQLVFIAIAYWHSID
jgi:uncharacterized membrane protein